MTCPTCGQECSWAKLDFGVRLRLLREARGLTQREAAKLIRMPQTTIASYEARQGFPAEKAVQLLAYGYGVSLTRLLGLEPEGMGPE